MTTVPLPSPDLYVNNENGECFAWGAEANPDMKGTHEPFYTATQLTDYAAAVSAAKDAEIERLRSALNNAEDALLNSQNWITAQKPNGFGAVCMKVNELALGIVRAALKGTP